MKQLIPFAFQVTSQVAPDFAAKIAAELFLRPKRYPLSQKETELLKKSRTETLQSGRKVYFWGQGPSDGSKTVTFVHGWESRGSAFHKWIPIFVENGFQVMAWDGPAHGESPGKRTHAPAIAKSLADDLKELGISPHAVVGHSLGGVVVGLLTKYLPVPAKVVIISSPAHIAPVFQRFQDQIHLSNRAREKFNERFLRMTGKTFDEVSLSENDLSQKAETLLIHDLDDREVPFADFEQLKKSWKNSRFLATVGLGHRRILRDESVAHQIIEFLKSQVRVEVINPRNL
jgi:pimeloyl-ACP methyl ester carboxylesterase